MSTQQILQAVNNIQPNAQAGLPVIPNNGNPGGAHNMPQGGEQVNAPAPAPVDPYAWLQPSPDMAAARQLLDKQLESSYKEEMLRESSQGRSRPVWRNGQRFEQMLLDNGLPLNSDVPAVVIDPYRDMPQHQPNPNALPHGTVIPLRQGL